MKVKKLIKKLSKLDKNSKVVLKFRGHGIMSVPNLRNVSECVMDGPLGFPIRPILEEDDPNYDEKMNLTRDEVDAKDIVIVLDGDQD